MSDVTKLYDIIRRPIVTEKSTLASEAGAVVFAVAMDANKASIREAIETLFKTDVKSVNTVITKGKRKRFRGRLGKRPNVKKAYVTLAQGKTIDVTSGL